MGQEADTDQRLWALPAFVYQHYARSYRAEAVEPDATHDDTTRGTQRLTERAAPASPAPRSGVSVSLAPF